MGAFASFFPIGSGLPHKRKGSACSPHYQVYPANRLSQLLPPAV